MQFTPVELNAQPDFDEENHAYSFRGWNLPGVSHMLEATGIKQPFDRTFWRLALLRKGMTPDEAEAEMDRKGKEGRDRGSLVHWGIEMSIKEGITELDSDADQILLDYMPHWQQWATEHELEDVLLMEQPLIHPTGFYCGTVDCLAVVGGELMVLDWKTQGASKRKPKAEQWQLYQLTAYLAAINTCGEQKALKAANVFLTPTGYMMHVWETSEIMEAWRNFQGLLRDYWIERVSQGQLYHHPDLARDALETIEARWGPFEDV